MATLGPRALMDIAIPTGVDAGEVLRFSMASGATPQEVVQLAATVIGEVNQTIAARYGNLVVFTTSPYARYRQGGTARTMTPDKTEFAQADEVRSDQIGHMLPLKRYQDAVGWSKEYLENADRDLLSFDLQEIRDRWVNRVDYDFVKRVLSKTENSIGSAGYDVPWVNGSAGNVPYIPTQWMGNVFDNTHTHFLRTNAAISSSNVITVLDSMNRHLSEHGHTGRKVALVSQADLAKYTGMASGKFAGLVPGEFRVTGGGASAAGSYTSTALGEVQGIPGELFGYFNGDDGVVELRTHERIPTGYLWMGKSYGANNTENPVAIRTGAKGFGLMVDPQVNRSLVPELEKILFNAQHGVGVNKRTNGVAAQIASGASTYDEPTIS